ncbi:DUF2628 domain-containing protein [Companilactobacillus sp.]|uniref:DUF2628 domain-containing protein n=1 Tax=Companilactobacillus sp. TaxID=2767905 RepID=UPI0026329FE1|nr:DUF2628 domain-containing protein [Companilactobacillus sp.]
MIIRMRNEQTGQVRETKVGYSWTTLLFGFFPALFRSDWKYAIIQFLTALAVGTVTMGFGTPLVPVVFSFIYNKLYINELIANGFTPADQYSNDTLRNEGFAVETSSSVDVEAD